MPKYHVLAAAEFDAQNDADARELERRPFKNGSFRIVDMYRLADDYGKPETDPTTGVVHFGTMD